ncbi:hypothetical protein BX616_003786 [Lobosporangium transversale]|uniref:Zinc finger PHD-type domain-containing protein n=1 Tax=Lobosporangium transversale TaxID=64571 RepID=A0A1Y2H0J5_9FUNG|nr:hypothetical protein BCR41DRAFT_344622 [Lobosporangium transversale]KAF9898639.1 hypothetical protein BX616_003786 [Lobosporangium transversale]ORZ28077.1 hypothetical protein BCR41DRAFT_344622 [Lobosporangium transversale]|eukprot:XP_021885762.1 hypothetical protein BCR41DRAFT_344622 [Lobosporangium transversale]
MASPRRSNRGGHSKGRKKEEDDDGGQTRCVCNQQHHEGVMIQCETCKVWQHCPCVGLGNGEVTPDKYYCESCQPDNHPYKVVHGQLISNSKSSSTQKPTKKRSTMNSKEASIPVDLMLAQQKWNEEHQDELEEEYAQRFATKRRKKTESIGSDINVETHPQDQTSNEHTSSSTSASATSSSSEKKKDKTSGPPFSSANNATGVAGLSANLSSSSSSPKTSSSNNGRISLGKKSSAKSVSKARSRSNSPNMNGHSSHNEDQDGSTAVSTKTGYSADGEDTKRSVSVDNAVSSSKRRKTNSKSEMTIHSESNSPEEEDEFTGKNDLSADYSEHHPKSRKTGNYLRGNKRNASTNDDHDYLSESSPSVTSPALASKKSFAKRSGDRGQGTKNGSRHTTPVPGHEGTLQPMAPTPPATVRYPSSKMTIQEMTRRAKQLLEYISRMQIDMADRKNKTISQSPQDSKEYATKLKDMNDELSLFRLPASASNASSLIHGDSQVCPDLSRSSMDSTSSLDSIHEPRSPVDTKVSIKETCSAKEMTIKVIPLDVHDQLPLLSTPPLSVHDRQHQHHRHGSGSPESDATHEPLTPPHNPLESHDDDLSHCRDSGSAVTKLEPAPTTSLELMDKLTGDLIRFQEKFGVHA